MAPSLRNNRDFGTFRLAALKEITLIHAIAEVEKPLVGLARRTEALKRQQPKWNWVSRPEELPNSNWRADLSGIPGAQEQLSARADRMVSFPPA
jgi:hypothetical protein